MATTENHRGGCPALGVTAVSSSSHTELAFHISRPQSAAVTRVPHHKTAMPVDWEKAQRWTSPETVSGDGVYFVMCEQQPINLWQVSTSLQIGQWAFIPPGSRSTKGNLESADSPAGQLLATRATGDSVFWLVGMLRSTVCHASYSEVQRASWAGRQVMPTFSLLIVNCRLFMPEEAKPWLSMGLLCYRTPKPRAST